MRAAALASAAAAAAFTLALSPAQAQRSVERPEGLRLAPQRWHALVGVRAHVAPGVVVDNATIVLRDGILESVGAGAPPPAGARVWSLPGRNVYAGFIDLNSPLGLPEALRGSERPSVADDDDEDDAPAPPAGERRRAAPTQRTLAARNALLRAEQDVAQQWLPPSAEQSRSARAVGFTAVLAAPGAGVFRGQSALLALRDPRQVPDPKNWLLKARVAQHHAFEVTPGWSGPYPNSLMGAVALSRQTLHDARWLQAQAQAQMPTAGSGPAPRERLAANATLEALGPVLGPVTRAGVGAPVDPNPSTTSSAQQPVLHTLRDELDVGRVAALQREFNLRSVLLGQGREYRVAAQLKRAGLPVVVPLTFPTAPDLRDPDRALDVPLDVLQHWEQAPSNLALLHRAGVPVAVTAAGLANPAEQFWPRLRQAIQRGLPPAQALAALTTVPAQLIGLEQRLGRIAPGQWAHLVVMQGDPFDADAADAATLEWRFVDGDAEPGPAALRPDPRGVWRVADAVAAGAAGNSGAGAASTGAVALRITGSRDAPRAQWGQGPACPLRPSAVDAAQWSVRWPCDAATAAGASSASTSSTASAGSADSSASSTTARSMPWAAAPSDAAAAARHATRASAAGSTREGTPPVQALQFSLQDDRLIGSMQAQAFMPLAVPTPPRWAAQAAGNSAPDDGAMAPWQPWRAERVAAAGAAAARSASGSTPAGPGSARHAAALPPAALSARYPAGAYGVLPPEQPPLILLRGATVWTQGPAGTLPKADVLLRAGKIAAVGPQLSVPAGTPVVEAAGLHLTPGLIDAHSHIAIAQGVNEGTNTVTAEVRIGDVLNPTDIAIYRQLAGGLTTAHLLHGSANTIGGQAQLIKLRWGQDAEGLRFAGAPASIKFALGENVKQSNWGSSGRYPQTRMGVAEVLRNAFQAAREYAAARQRWATAPAATRGPEPRRDLQLDALVEILQGQRFIHIHSYRADEILMFARFAKAEGLPVGAFQHVLEGYKVPDAIAAAGAGASTFSDWWAYKMEVIDAVPTNARLMAQAGVLTSLNSDDTELARRMNGEAAKAVKYGGFTDEQALALVTRNPARQLRVDDRIGSIEVGKDADLVLWSGHPLAAGTRALQTWIDGRRYYSVDDDARLRAEAAAERARLIERVALEAARGGDKASDKGFDKAAEGGRDDPPGPGTDGPRRSAAARQRLDATLDSGQWRTLIQRQTGIGQLYGDGQETHGCVVEEVR